MPSATNQTKNTVIAARTTKGAPATPEYCKARPQAPFQHQYEQYPAK